MQKEVKNIDITDLPDLLRLAQEVQESRQPRLLKRGQQELALLSPVEPPPAATKPATRRAKGQPGNSNDWLLRLSEVGAEAPPPSDGATDVSSNKYKYLAEAYYQEFHPKAK